MQGKENMRGGWRNAANHEGIQGGAQLTTRGGKEGSVHLNMKVEGR